MADSTQLFFSQALRLVPIKRLRKLATNATRFTKFSSDIGNYYSRRFGEKASMGSDDELSDKVYILVDYFEHVNAIGYAKVSRLYAIATIYRQLFFYTICLLILELLDRPFSLIQFSILLISLIVFYLGVVYSYRLTAQAQLRYIVTSAQLWEDVPDTQPNIADAQRAQNQGPE